MNKDEGYTLDGFVSENGDDGVYSVVCVDFLSQATRIIGKQACTLLLELYGLNYLV